MLIYRPRRKKGLSEKLLHNWVGPYKVIKRLTDLNYEIKKPGGRQPIVVHVSQMKKFVVGEAVGSDEEPDEQMAQAVDVDVPLGVSSDAIATVLPNQNLRARDGVTVASQQAQDPIAVGNTSVTSLLPNYSSEVIVKDVFTRTWESNDYGVNDANTTRNNSKRTEHSRPVRAKRHPGWMKNMVLSSLLCVCCCVVHINVTSFIDEEAEEIFNKLRIPGTNQDKKAMKSPIFEESPLALRPLRK